jgi:hypothetical protein
MKRRRKKKRGDSKMVDSDDETLEVEDQCISALPGDMEPEEHIVERLVPTEGIIARQMAQAREGHRVAEEFPDRGAYHGGPPIPDMGGVTVPADPRNLIGTFVPVPSDSVSPPRTGGRKMRIQTWDEARAEIRQDRAELQEQQRIQRIAELEVELADLKGE